MEINDWTRRVRAVYEKALARYRNGNRELDSYFDDSELEFLASIGLRPINVYDYVEDFATAGEPDWDTFLLVMAARRDYFLYHQHRAPNPAVTSAEELPPKEAELGGIVWLPRIIAKARCFLKGGLCNDIMYGCGGDRAFLRRHGIHPADFLRAVWAAKDDDHAMLDFVRAWSRSQAAAA